MPQGMDVGCWDTGPPLLLPFAQGPEPGQLLQPWRGTDLSHPAGTLCPAEPAPSPRRHRGVAWHFWTAPCHLGSHIWGHPCALGTVGAPDGTEGSRPEPRVPTQGGRVPAGAGPCHGG